MGDVDITFPDIVAPPVIAGVLILGVVKNVIPDKIFELPVDTIPLHPIFPYTINALFIQHWANIGAVPIPTLDQKITAPFTIVPLWLLVWKYLLDKLTLFSWRLLAFNVWVQVILPVLFINKWDPAPPDWRIKLFPAPLKTTSPALALLLQLKLELAQAKAPLFVFWRAKPPLVALTIVLPVSVPPVKGKN